MQINKLSLGNLSGAIAGYDPGGNGGYGFALAELEKGQCKSLRIETLENAEEVIKNLGQTQSLLALGIDTLAAWATGPSGWRPADLWLRKKYRPILPSIVSPNGLYGSMGLNGMAVLASIRQNSPEICVT
jgi:predicted nuclease with RNAse H fold